MGRSEGSTVPENEPHGDDFLEVMTQITVPMIPIITSANTPTAILFCTSRRLMPRRMRLAVSRVPETSPVCEVGRR